MAGIVSTPLFWLLNSPDTGQLVAASVQGLVAIAAFVWALMQPPAGPSRPPSANSAAADRAAHTGGAEARDGGSAATGIRRAAGSEGGSAVAEHTGDATAHGPGSSASTGIEYT
ncbi:hypothetical protein ACFVXA_23985 [Streptomyces sp. NPDC058246]|uniref:hypothetical protein n=1 Tax=Streptomyces sp. NPDC058246 TaxID=3346400 RepID=UPI0036E97A5F